MDIIIRAAAIAIITASAALIVKKSNPESAYIIGVIGAVVILAAAVNMLSSIKEAFDSVVLSTELSSAVFSPLIKCTAIAVTVRIVSSLSKDSGQNGIASAVEFLGAAAAIYTSLPLISSVLQTIGDLL